MESKAESSKRNIQSATETDYYRVGPDRKSNVKFAVQIGRFRKVSEQHFH